MTLFHRLGRAVLTGTALLLSAPLAAVTLPPGFQDLTVVSGLTQPTAVRFSPDGRVFVIEKSGIIKVIDSLSNPTPTVLADLRTNVYNFYDLGLVGLALDPNFPASPYVYIAYTLDAPIGGTPPVWGSSGGTADSCPNPPGANTNGCVVSARLSRLQIQGDTMVGGEQVLMNDWCQQFPSHTVGSLVFGSDGALYISAGEGAGFNNPDYGQFGSPLNPCGDPPVGVGGVQTPPTAEGGALRAQSLRRTPGEPATVSGTVLRLNPQTGQALPDNPLYTSSRPNSARIIASGLRNPFRMATRPGTRELWLGDVGLTDYEEINRITDYTGGGVPNFGWPCYEGPNQQATYASLGLNICTGLYANPGATTAPFYSYNHAQQVVPGESCGTGSSAVSGLAFYASGAYPAKYNGALFFADYARSCIWAMLTGANGDPDPSTRTTFAAGAPTPVDLETGPGGDLFYVAINAGEIHRIQSTSSGQPPTAVIKATPQSGPLPLTVQFDGSGSTSSNPSSLSYAWDLNGDGLYNDSTAVAPQYTYTTKGTVNVGLKVTDGTGQSGTSSVVITAGTAPPSPTILTPSASATWDVGDLITFSGSATDWQGKPLPASALTWTIILQHCPSNCHTHTLQTVSGVSQGSFSAPDHDYPAYLEIQLTATDSAGLSATTSVSIYPNTSTLNFTSNPSGATISVGVVNSATPYTTTAIVGANVSVSAASPQEINGVIQNFSSWSDGGAESHTITAPAGGAGYAVNFAPAVPDTATPTASPTATDTPAPPPTASPTATDAPSPTPPPAICAGDCNGDGKVSVDELLVLVNIALGQTGLDACPAGDMDHNGQITIDEILMAVVNALNGCQAGA